MRRASEAWIGSGEVDSGGGRDFGVQKSRKLFGGRLDLYAQEVAEKWAGRDGVQGDSLCA